MTFCVCSALLARLTPVICARNCTRGSGVPAAMITQFTSQRAWLIRIACFLAATSLLCGLAAAPPALAAASDPLHAAAAKATPAASRAYQTEQQAVAQA